MAVLRTADGSLPLYADETSARLSVSPLLLSCACVCAPPYPSICGGHTVSSSRRAVFVLPLRPAFTSPSSLLLDECTHTHTHVQAVQAFFLLVRYAGFRGGGWVREGESFEGAALAVELFLWRISSERPTSTLLFCITLFSLDTCTLARGYPSDATTSVAVFIHVCHSVLASCRLQSLCHMGAKTCTHTHTHKHAHAHAAGRHPPSSLPFTKHTTRS